MDVVCDVLESNPRGGLRGLPAFIAVNGPRETKTGRHTRNSKPNAKAQGNQQRTRE